MSRLSHSSLEKYKTCPKMWDFHYNKRIRERQIGSPLFFGGAIDESLNALLLQKKKVLTEDEKELVKQSPYELFDKDFTNVSYNGETFDISQSLNARYSTADFDGDILLQEDIDKMSVYLSDNNYEDISNPIKNMLLIKAFIKQNTFMKLDEVDKIYYNYCNWISLRRKGHMMIDAYKKDLLPTIKEVVSIQKKIELDNGEGDTIIGYIDFEAILEGEDFVRICDNKTSAKKYKPESVKESQQLTIYCEAQQLDNAAFYVLLKTVRKVKHKTCKICQTVTTGREKTCKEGGTGKNRCSGEFDVELECLIDTQIIKDSISEDKKELTFDVIQDILGDINEGLFDKIEKSNCFMYGKRCPYYDKCWVDKDSTKGLKELV